MPGYVLFKRLAKKKQATLEKEFGSLISVFANNTGAMRSDTHLEFFLKDVLPKVVSPQYFFESYLPIDDYQ